MNRETKRRRERLHVDRYEHELLIMWLAIYVVELGEVTSEFHRGVLIGIAEEDDQHVHQSRQYVQ